MKKEKKDILISLIWIVFTIVLFSGALVAITHEKTLRCKTCGRTVEYREKFCPICGIEMNDSTTIKASFHDIRHKNLIKNGEQKN